MFNALVRTLPDSSRGLRQSVNILEIRGRGSNPPKTVQGNLDTFAKAASVLVGMNGDAIRG